ncbi:MAG: hypothetical protein F4Y39_13545 [Gemmatimonadetes bacterium]|nr:hypothetical protein [Gemmatimonadota bacterium]MYF74092.1 hypothetical protein [Gemmatimonadota bacterium]MYK54123.1 hypothetical protein [Gemmatimonadota bacterium]
MPQPFLVRTSSRFLRDARKRLRQHPELVEVLEGLRVILGEDPYNHTRQYHIKKLKDIKSGEGQWRIRHGDYRLRYDIFGQEVVLYSFRHRREVY